MPDAVRVVKNLPSSGADDRIRTGDLVLTKDALYRLSYIGRSLPPSRNQRTASAQPSYSVERETGIEPATNSLEGCDSTTELLPPIPAVVLRLASNGGEGRIRTSEAAGATDLQSVAFDRFATSPKKQYSSLVARRSTLNRRPNPPSAWNERGSRDDVGWA